MQRAFITVNGKKIYGRFPQEYERTCDLESCGKIAGSADRVNITGRMYLPDNVSAPLDLDFHEECLPAEFTVLARLARRLEMKIQETAKERDHG